MLSSRLRHQGTYVYGQNLIAQFKRIAEADPEVSFCLFASPKAANDANAIEPVSGFDLSRTAWLAWDRLWRLGGVSLAASRARADLIFSPTSNILPSGSIPVVCTIHDITPVVMPSHARRVTLMLRSLLFWACRRSRAIITVSEHSKKDLVRTYGLAESKISVIYNGYDDGIFNNSAPDGERQQRLRERFGLVRPYLWHHGVIQPRKNLKRLIQAHRLILERNRNLEVDLILAGPLGWEYEETLAAATNTNNGRNHRGRVILTGALDDSDLVALLKGARLAVMPSLYEGFCFPMVEAMACGVPVVAASTSCLPEISGGVLKYFDPASVEDMAGCIEKTLENDEIKNDLARKGRETAARYNWRRCADETLAVLVQAGTQVNPRSSG